MRRFVVATVAGFAFGAMTFSAGAAGAEGVCEVEVDDGELAISCDDADNDVVVMQSAFGSDEYEISSAFGTQFDLGSGPVAGPVVVSGVTGEVDIDVAGGQSFVGQCSASDQPSGRCPGDRVEVVGAAIHGDLRISSDDGRNEVLVADSEVADRIKVDNGNGGSETDCESTVVGSDLRYKNGDGFNEAKVDGCTVARRVKFSSGTGSTSVDIESGTWIGDHVEVETGDGVEHEVAVEESTILGDVRIEHGNAEEIVLEMEAEEGTQIYIGGSIEIEHGAALLHVFELEGAEGEMNLEVAGSIEIDNGPGDSEVTLEKSVTIGRSFHQRSGEGFDELVFEPSVVLGGHVEIEHGDGGSETVLEGAQIGGWLAIDSGLGSDLVELLGITAGRTDITTGADDDTVFVQGSTFPRYFDADGGEGTGDVFEDGGANLFDELNLMNFEVVLP